MKNLFPFLLLFIIACSQTPKKEPVTQKQLAGPNKHIDFGKMNFGKPAASKNALLMTEIPFDSSLIPEESLQNYFRFVRHNNLIVLQLDADTNLATGNPKMVDMSFSPAAVTKNADMTKVPDSLKNFIGKKFHMIGENGEAFDAEIKSLKILVEFFPNYGETEAENGTDHSDSLKIAKNTWQDGNTGKAMLVGETEINSVEGMMIDGAVPAEMPVPVLLEPVKGSSIQKQLENDIKLTEQFSVIQKNYIRSLSSSSDTSEKWSDQADEQFYSCISSGSKGYSTLTQSAGTFCGDEFYADLTSVWETDPGKKNKILFSFPGFSSTTMIFDIEGDGIPEILVQDFNNSPILFKKVDGRWKAVSYFSIMDWRCPC